MNSRLFLLKQVCDTSSFHMVTPYRVSAASMVRLLCVTINWVSVENSRNAWVNGRKISHHPAAHESHLIYKKDLVLQDKKIANKSEIAVRDFHRRTTDKWSEHVCPWDEPKSQYLPPEDASHPVSECLHRT